MRTVFALQLAFILFAHSLLAADDDPRNIAGYGKTVWGMTEDEVLQAEAPLAQKLDPPVKTAGGGIRAVTISDIKVGSKAGFSAQFIFDSKDRKLTQVTLESPKLSSSRESRDTFSDIEKLLTEKYGSPTYKQEGKNVSWKLTKRTIELMNVNIPQAGWVQVYVMYKPVGASADASKNL